MPGVIYSRQLEFTSHGPVVIHVISAPKTDRPLRAEADPLERGGVGP